jgi:transposase
LDQEPLFLLDRTGSNSQWDFLDFVVTAIEENYLRNGDVLVLDNAKIHKAEAMLPHLMDVLETIGVRIIYLPAYSPELNPCELVFGHVKSKLYTRRESFLTLKEDLSVCFAEIERPMLEKWYLKCLNHFRNHRFAFPPGISDPLEGQIPEPGPEVAFV